MSLLTRPTPPELKRSGWLPTLEGAVVTALVLVSLPLSQWINDPGGPPPPVVEPGPTTTSPVLPDPEIEKIKDEKPPIKELEMDRPKPTLAEIEVAIDPKLTGIGGGTVPIVLPSAEDWIEDFVALEKLTKPPRPVSRVSPVYPPEMRAAGLPGEVLLIFKVRSDGTTSEHEVVRSTHPAFEEAAIRSVRKWQFAPGEKDGRQVATRVKILIPFRVN